MLLPVHEMLFSLCCYRDDSPLGPMSKQRLGLEAVQGLQLLLKKHLEGDTSSLSAQ